MDERLLTAEKKEIRIQNVVTSAAFKHGIDLNAIVKAFSILISVDTPSFEEGALYTSAYR